MVSCPSMNYIFLWITESLNTYMHNSGSLWFLSGRLPQHTLIQLNLTTVAGIALKGQTKSWYFFQAVDSSKNLINHFFFFMTGKHMKEINCLFFWKNSRIPKSPFQTNRPLVCSWWRSTLTEKQGGKSNVCLTDAFVFFPYVVFREKVSGVCWFPCFVCVI